MKEDGLDDEGMVGHVWKLQLQISSGHCWCTCKYGVDDTMKWSFCVYLAIYLIFHSLTHICVLQLEQFTMCMLHLLPNDVFSSEKRCQVGASSRPSITEVMSRRQRTKQMPRRVHHHLRRQVLWCIWYMLVHASDLISNWAVKSRISLHGQDEFHLVPLQNNFGSGNTEAQTYFSLKDSETRAEPRGTETWSRWEASFSNRWECSFYKWGSIYRFPCHRIK